MPTLVEYILGGALIVTLVSLLIGANVYVWRWILRKER